MPNHNRASFNIYIVQVYPGLPLFGFQKHSEEEKETVELVLVSLSTLVNYIIVNFSNLKAN